MPEESGYPKDMLKSSVKAPDIGMGPQLEPLSVPEPSEDDAEVLDDQPVEPLADPEIQEVAAPDADVPEFQSVAAMDPLPDAELPALATPEPVDTPEIDVLTASPDDFTDEVRLPDTDQSVSMLDLPDQPVPEPAEISEVTIPEQVTNEIDPLPDPEPQQDDAVDVGSMQVESDTPDVETSPAVTSEAPEPLSPLSDPAPSHERVEDETGPIGERRKKADPVSSALSVAGDSGQDMTQIHDKLDRIEMLLMRMQADRAATDNDPAGFRFKR